MANLVAIAEEDRFNSKMNESVKGIYIFDTNDFLRDLIKDHHYRQDFYSILVLEKGEIKLRYNVDDITLLAPAVFFFVAGSQTIFKNVSEDISLYGLVYSLQYIKQTGLHLTGTEALNIFERSASYSQLTETELLVLTKLAEVLGAILARVPHRFQLEVVNNLFLAFLFEVRHILGKRIPEAQVVISRNEDILVNFYRLRLEYFKKERSVSFYADKLNITARHLSQVLKLMTGQTAGEMLDEAVIAEAKRLLINPNYNISQISHILNFSDPSFFGKYFKKHTGLTPKEFRFSKT
ncbi:MAG TPA: helix-turn-helix domain-containing protein [Patescibacteria group bacterium]|nr:helix-turn-helix domain-containing protein [Patescibacteria group bacterium]